MITAYDVGPLSTSLSRWELGEYIFEALVIVACAGELVAGLGRLPMRCKRRIERWSTMLLVAALSLELICLVRTNQLSGNVIDSLGEKAEEADRKAKRAIADSSTALAQAIDALTKAGKASDSLGKAEDKANKAQTASSNALALARGARSEADSFEKDIVSANKQAAEAEAHLAEARQLAANAVQGTAAVTAKIAGRRLTEEQKEKLKSLLKPFAPTMIELEWTGPGGQEAADLASDINDAIVSAGIPITQANRMVLMDQYFKGVFLRVGDERKVEAQAVALFLIETNLSTRPVSTLPPNNPQRLAIVIGAKP
jgi:hypothetical protein